MTQQYQERRRDIRVVFRTTVRIKFPDKRSFDDCETSDISVSGVFVKGVDSIDIGETCQVELQLTGQTSVLVLKMTGEVVRIEEEGIGLQFLEVDEDSFYHLQNIVYFTYKHANGRMDFLGDLDDTEDETLYSGLDEKVGKSKPLPDDYLDDFGEDEDDFEDETIENIAEHIRRRQDDDNY